MKINYQIRIKVKNAEWYERAKDFKSVEAFEVWDQDKTARYVHQVAFKFTINVESIVMSENVTHDVLCKDENQDQVSILIPNLRVIEFNGEINTHVLISESLIDQAFIEKRGKGKTYVNCYLKADVEYHDLSENMWLSDKHLKMIRERFPDRCNFVLPKIELISFGGVMPTFHDRNDD